MLITGKGWCATLSRWIMHSRIMNYYLVKPKNGYYSFSGTEAMIVGATSEEEAIAVAASIPKRCEGWNIIPENGPGYRPVSDVEAHLCARRLTDAGIALIRETDPLG